MKNVMVTVALKLTSCVRDFAPSRPVYLRKLGDFAIGSRVQPPCLLVVPHHCELNQLNLLTCEITYRFDEPATDPDLPRRKSNVHAPEYAFVRSFLTLLDGEARNSGQLSVAERAL